MRSTSSGSAWTAWLAAAQAQRQALLERGRLEVQAELAEHLAELEMLGPHLDAAGVDPGDVEQLGEQALERVDRLVDAVDQLRHLVARGSRWRSASANRPIACSGWRRSWLAAAKNCVFARLATSASRRAASASAASRARSCAASSPSVRSFSSVHPLEAPGGSCAPSSVVSAHDQQQLAGELQAVDVAVAGRCARSSAPKHSAEKTRKTRDCVGQDRHWRRCSTCRRRGSAPVCWSRAAVRRRRASAARPHSAPETSVATFQMRRQAIHSRPPARIASR